MVKAEPEPLLELGTRFQHWSELLDTFRSAVVIIDNIRPGYITVADKAKKVKIENAIELVESQLNRFSNRDEAQLRLAKLIDALPKVEDTNVREQRLLSTGETILPHEATGTEGRDEGVPPDANC